MKSTQAQIKASIAQYVELQGGYGVVTNIAGIPIKGDRGSYRRNKEMSGLGDVLVCWGGLFLQFEVKRTSQEELSDGQKEHKRRLEHAGGIYYQVTCLDEVIEILKKRRKFNDDLEDSLRTGHVAQDDCVRLRGLIKKKDEVIKKWSDANLKSMNIGGGQ